MSTMNISLPKALKAFVDQQVASGGYSTSSEYVRDVLRKERDRQRLRDLVQEGMASPVAGPVDNAYFDSLRKRVKAKSSARSRKTA